MSCVADRLKKVMTYSEINILKNVINEMEGKTEAVIVTAKVSDKLGVSRANIVNALRMLGAAGVAESRSLGMKGTNIKILDVGVLKELLN